MRNSRPAGTYHEGDWVDTWWSKKGRWVVAVILDIGTRQDQRRGVFARMRNTCGKCTPYWVPRDFLKDVIRHSEDVQPGERIFRRDLII